MRPSIPNILSPKPKIIIFKLRFEVPKHVISKSSKFIEAKRPQCIQLSSSKHNFIYIIIKLITGCHKHWYAAHRSCIYSIWPLPFGGWNNSRRYTIVEYVRYVYGFRFKFFRYMYTAHTIVALCFVTTVLFNFSAPPLKAKQSRAEHSTQLGHLNFI